MKKKKIPVRMCIGCECKKPKKEMLRIVKTPENDIFVDATGKKSGRGAYICYSSDCFGLACEKKSIEKALGTKMNDNDLKVVKEEFNKINKR